MGLLSMFSGAPKKPDLPNMPQVQQPQQQAPAKPQQSDFMHVMSYHGPLNRALATRPSMIEQYKAGSATPPPFLRPEDYSFMGITPPGIAQGNYAQGGARGTFDPLGFNQNADHPGIAGNNLMDDQYRMKVIGSAPPEIIANSIAMANRRPMTLTKLSQVNGSVRDMVGGDPQNFYKTSMIGNASAKYESNGNPLAANPDAGGGWSYGAYQMNTNGAVQKFINEYYKEAFSGLKPGTDAFNKRWKEVGGKNPEFFEQQHQFIHQSKFQPVRNYANKIGVPDNRLINEALWSMSVQHGGASNILNKAVKSFKGDINSDIAGFLKHLYNVRTQYVNGLSNLSGGVKKGIANRYKNEYNTILGMRE
jgi:hypothetical protein